MESNNKQKHLSVINKDHTISFKAIDNITKAMTKDQLDSLGESDRRMYEILNFADDQIRFYGPGKTAATVIKNKYDISHSYAMKLIYSAQVVFGANKFEKNWHKGFAAEKLIRMLTAMENRMLIQEEGNDGSLIEVLNKDVKISELKAYASLLKEYRETMGYDKEEDDMPDWGEVGANLIIPMIDPKLLGVEDYDGVDQEITQYFEKLYESNNVTDADFTTE